MELRKTEEELSSLVEQYKSLCLRSLLLNQQLEEPGEIMELTPWEKLLAETRGKKVEKSCLPVENSGKLDEDVSTTAQNSNNDVSVKELLDAIINMRHSLDIIVPKVDKFRARLTMKDPVTNAPRYGQKTIERVQRLIDTYEVLRNGMDVAFASDSDSSKGCIVKTLRRCLESERSSIQKMQEEERTSKLKAELQQKERQIEIEIELRRKEEKEKQKKQEEIEELSRRAKEARSRRIRNEQRATEQERQVDQHFLSSVEVGINGVKTQLGILRENCTQPEFDTALKSLYTIFKQISSRPEEIQFRRIRRDHPKFIEDIGRHPGGGEFLVAAGFTFQEIDGKKCFFSAEPDLMTNMDGWSSWFNLIKATFQHLNDEISK